MTLPVIGMFLPMPEPGAGSVREIADAARRLEAHGLESAWQGDLLVGRYAALSAGAVLAAAAAVTERINLGYAVQVPALYPLPLLAHELATVQYLSGGRVLYGATPGDGPFERWRGGLRDQAAWRALGVDYAERERLTDAALARLPELFAGNPVPVDPSGEGEFALSLPVPRPPILVGGGSDSALERAVRYGDAWFPAIAAPSRIAAGAARLRELAEAEGRPMPGITVALPLSLGADDTPEKRAGMGRTIAELYDIPADEAGEVPVLGTPADAAARIAAYGEAGADRVVFSVSNDIWDAHLELLREVVRLLAD